MQVEYTLDELVAAVASRLAAVGPDRQANGQVSAFPDRRTLRYYTTIGLMDRPDTVRDRQAIYGERHIAQAVAVKRLQAAGLALAAIQAHLAGLPPAGVEAIASGRTDASGDGARDRRRGFWTRSATDTPAAGAPTVSTDQGRDGPIRPMAADSAGAAPAPGGDDPTRPTYHRPVTAAAAPIRESEARHLQAVTLAPGVELHLATGQALSAGDVTAIRGAATPLLGHLSAAGLLPADSRDLLERDCR